MSASSAAPTYLEVNSHLLKKQISIVSGYVYVTTLKQIAANANLIKFSTPPVDTYYMPMINITDNTITYATIGSDGYLKNKKDLPAGKVFVINPVYSVS